MGQARIVKGKGLRLVENIRNSEIGESLLFSAFGDRKRRPLKIQGLASNFKERQLRSLRVLTGLLAYRDLPLFPLKRNLKQIQQPALTHHSEIQAVWIGVKTPTSDQTVVCPSTDSSALQLTFRNPICSWQRCEFLCSTLSSRWPLSG